VIPRVDAHAVDRLGAGWTLARADPGSPAPPARWPATVPGTVASALTAAGEELGELDRHDWWFARSLALEPPGDDEELALELGGIATLADVYLDGRPILHSPSMFARHLVALGGRSRELQIACRSLDVALAERRPRPRFRARGVANQRLRYIRTSLLGRGGATPACPPPIGPYRPIAVVRRRKLALDSYRRDVAYAGDVDGGAGRLRVEAVVRALGADGPASARLVAAGATGEHAADARLERRADGRVELWAELAIGDVAPWLPHTHGAPNLYGVRLELALASGQEVRIDDRPAGFRALANDPATAAGGGLALSVSGVPVFCRGALWAPADPVSLAAPPAAVRARLAALRDAGLNIVRLPGDGLWEDEAFHRACDELGLLVWQDLMLSRMDYPTEDPEFAALLEDEVGGELARVGAHASTAVICGGDELEQQPAMLGLPPGTGRSAFISERLPEITAAACPGIPLIPSSPSGGELPFRVATGVSHYFGIGAYRRELADARMSGVAFAAACLAFANVPEQALLDELASGDAGRAVPGAAAWKRGVPRDPGESWDFDDVRDHYLRELYGVDPDDLRGRDPARYLDLSRMASGEAMAAALGEWRRPAAPCAGALVLAAADLVPGAGWGLLDARGAAKPALAILARVCRPRAVWLIDEGLDGVDVHVANDAPERLAFALRVALYRDDGTRVEEAERELELGPHAGLRIGAEAVLGRFADVSWAYRFGPRSHDLVVASARLAGARLPFAQGFRRVGSPLPPTVALEELGIACAPAWDGEALELELTAERVAWGVRALAPGMVADDAWFALEPGRPRGVRLSPAGGGGPRPRRLAIEAVNATGHAVLDVPARAS
jgi:beta-mannosidase